jgi:SsrA-binding protein
MSKANARNAANKFVAQNRRARFDYEIVETLTAGLVLQGTEVKSLRQGRCSLNEAFAQEQNLSAGQPL